MKNPAEAIALFKNEPGALERLLETAGDALFIVDAERNIVFWNGQAERLTGFAAAEVIGRYCLAGMRCETCLYTCDLFEQDEIRDRRVLLRARDGRTLHCTKNAFVLRDQAGALLGAVEFLRDETALVEQVERCSEQRRRLAAREQLQAAVLGSICEGVITIDREFAITSFSARAEAIFGLEAEAAIGKACHEVIPSELCRTACPAKLCFGGEGREAEGLAEIEVAGGSTRSIAERAVPLRSQGAAVMGAALILEDRTFPGQGRDGTIHFGLSGMVGQSPAMRAVFRVIEQVAPTETTVLLTGESGTGKEMAAQALHRLSQRRRGPLQVINCAALPESLLESELFGHARGAFTGAVRDRPGRIEQAAHGTFFLDEIGELPTALQVKFLRFLQEREYQRVGEDRTRSADVRIIAATNRDLPADVSSGRFRQDLFYRLSVIPLEMPPLRERVGDIPLLAAHLLPAIAQRMGRTNKILVPAVLESLARYSWPGNVRELINALEYAVALSPGRRIRPEDLPPEISGGAGRYRRARLPRPDRERELIEDALRRTQGNRSAAARLLGMNRVTLYRKLKKHALS